jgi:hypothetical protein
MSFHGIRVAPGVIMHDSKSPRGVKASFLDAHEKLPIAYSVRAAFRLWHGLLVGRNKPVIPHAVAETRCASERG